MPPQKRQHARTTGKGASKAVVSRSAAPRHSDDEPAARDAKKERRPPQCKHMKDQGDRQMQGQTLKVTLPGEMYERAGRWWWRVKLPGEDKARARPLRAAGAKAATDDPDVAEKIAVEMWERAVRQHGARQIALDCEQKVERLKAQFLDKVRHLTEIVESANARAHAEAQARAETEARFNAMIQTAGQKTVASSAQAQSLASWQPPEQAMPFDTGPADSPEGSEDALPMKRDAAGTACPAYPASTPVATDGHIAQPQTGICECCGAAEVPVPDLAPIDSGQLLCPDCLTALHIDISRIESKAFSGSRA